MSEHPRTAIVGATGFIGSHLYQAYRELDHKTLGTTRDPKNVKLVYLDLRRPVARPLHLEENGIRHALIVAAEPNVTRCEVYRRVSTTINVIGTLKLIEQLLKANVRPIFFSTDYVFGREQGNYVEDDDCQPQTLYGQQKREVEMRLAKMAPDNHLIVRLSKIFSLEPQNGILLDEMASLLARGKTVRAAHDQIFNPMHIGDLVKVLMFLQREDKVGTWNVCGDEAMSRYEQARGLARAMGKDEALIKRISLDDLGTRPPRPHNTSMSNAKLRSIYTAPMVTIAEYISKTAQNWAST